MARLYNYAILLAAFLAGFSGTGLAQEPTPTPPFVGEAPATGGWKISVTYKLAQPEPTDKQSAAHANWERLQKIVPSIKEIRVGKADGRRKEIIFYSQGVQDEKYSVGNVEFVRKAAFAPGDVFVSEIGGGAKSDFPEFSWIAAADYTGVRELNGKKCYVFISSKSPGQTLEAWIDVTTKLPARLEDGMYDRRYEYFSSPGIPMEPSAEIARRVQTYLSKRRL